MYGIKASVDCMFVIFFFECDFYVKYDYEVDFVGYLFMDVVEAFEVFVDFIMVY